MALIQPEGMRISTALRARGIIPDSRSPDIIRISPIALYNTYRKLWELARHLREIVERREFEPFPMDRATVP